MDLFFYGLFVRYAKSTKSRYLFLLVQIQFMTPVVVEYITFIILKLLRFFYRSYLFCIAYLYVSLNYFKFSKNIIDLFLRYKVFFIVNGFQNQRLLQFAIDLFCNVF